jgi:primosomal protein N'
VRIVFADRDERTAEHACLDYAKRLEIEIRSILGEEGKQDLLLLVAAEAPVARISGFSRYQILIKLLRTKRLKNAIGTITAFHDLHRDVCSEVQLEINPQEMF